MGRTALVFINRHSRRGAALADTALDALRAHGLNVVEPDPAHADDVGTAIRAHRGALDLIVIGGGDGTLNGAVEAVLETGLPLGVVPLGTGNDLARTLGLPLDVTAACTVIAEGRPHRIDLGQANDKLYFNVASIGLSVQIAKRLTKSRKRQLAMLAYPLTTYEVMKSGGSFHATLRHDGATLELDALQIAIGNGRHYGGGMTICEGARIDDGQLDVYALPPETFWRLLLRVPALRAGRTRAMPDVPTWQGREIEIVTPRPMPVNTDGELTTTTPLRIVLHRRALPVMVARDGLAEQPGVTADVADG